MSIQKTSILYIFKYYNIYKIIFYINIIYNDISKIWGPHAWYLFHVLSFTWEKKHIKTYKRFFELIAKTIPCEICKENFNSKISRPALSINNNCNEKKNV